MPIPIYLSVFVFTFLVITVLSLKRSRQVTTGEGFVVADRSMNASGVSWVIIGTLVGGASTIGTVQLAYESGLSAWIFTLGSGIACLLLGLFFAEALRQQGTVTVSEFLGLRFGVRFQRYSSAVTALGMFVHVVGQYLAAIAILQSIFGFSLWVSMAMTFVLLVVFVTVGGMGGASLIGKFKFFMLYGMLLAAAGVAIFKAGGVGQFLRGLPPEQHLFNLFGYGFGRGVIDLGAMIVGVISTQVYLQAIFSARDIRAARNGAFISAAVIPPVGALGIVIGLFLKVHHPELAGNTARALPFFLNTYFPDGLAAFFSAGLLLVVLGTGAGLILGVTTNLDVDFLQTAYRIIDPRKRLLRLRLTSLLVLGLSLLLVLTGLSTTILQWSYLSMGLRGSAVFAGLGFAVCLPKMVARTFLRPVLYLLPLAYVVVTIWFGLGA